MQGLLIELLTYSQASLFVIMVGAQQLDRVMRAPGYAVHSLIRSFSTSEGSEGHQHHTIMTTIKSAGHPVSKKVPHSFEGVSLLVETTMQSPEATPLRQLFIVEELSMLTSFLLYIASFYVLPKQILLTLDISVAHSILPRIPSLLLSI